MSTGSPPGAFLCFNHRPPCVQTRWRATTCMAMAMPRKESLPLSPARMSVRSWSERNMRTETRVNILSTPLDALSFAETVECARTSIITRHSTQQVSMNVAKLVKMRTDAVLREDVLSSDIISADGVGIVWACKVLGLSDVQRVAGVDLMFAILELCAKEGYRPYFLGARPEVLDRAIQSVHVRWPGLKVAGAHHGYFKNNEEESVLDDILLAHPDCLFIAMPTPRKERFLAQHRSHLNVPYIMGVGGS